MFIYLLTIIVKRNKLSYQTERERRKQAMWDKKQNHKPQKRGNGVEAPSLEIRTGNFVQVGYPTSSKYIPLVEFMHLVFTRIPSELP